MIADSMADRVGARRARPRYLAQPVDVHAGFACVTTVGKVATGCGIRRARWAPGQPWATGASINPAMAASLSSRASTAASMTRQWLPLCHDAARPRHPCPRSPRRPWDEQDPAVKPRGDRVRAGGGRLMAAGQAGPAPHPVLGEPSTVAGAWHEAGTPRTFHRGRRAEHESGLRELSTRGRRTGHEIPQWLLLSCRGSTPGIHAHARRAAPGTSMDPAVKPRGDRARGRAAG